MQQLNPGANLNEVEILIRASQSYNKPIPTWQSSSVGLCLVRLVQITAGCLSHSYYSSWAFRWIPLSLVNMVCSVLTEIILYRGRDKPESMMTIQRHLPHRGAEIRNKGRWRSSSKTEDYVKIYRYIYLYRFIYKINAVKFHPDTQSNGNILLICTSRHNVIQILIRINSPFKGDWRLFHKWWSSGRLSQTQ